LSEQWQASDLSCEVKGHQALTASVAHSWRPIFKY